MSVIVVELRGPVLYGWCWSLSHGHRFFGMLFFYECFLVLGLVARCSVRVSVFSGAMPVAGARVGDLRGCLSPLLLTIRGLILRGLYGSRF